MSTIRTTITLKNAADVANAERGLITEAEVRALTVEALVDTGAWTLAIDEGTCQKLGLRLTGSEGAVLADGTRVVCHRTDGVEVHWKDRDTVCPALVVPDVGDILFGALPMEGMDLIIHPRTEELVGAHGDTVLRLLK